MSFGSNIARGFSVDRWWRHYRIAHRGGVLRLLFTLIYMREASNNGGYVGKETQFKGKPNLPHGFHGVHISREAVIGENVTIFQNVTIGSNNGAAIIGNNVLIGAGAIVLGDICVGEGAKIGAGAIVVDDVPNGATVISPKAKIL